MIDIKWGPEIQVDGKRPEWLTYGDKIDVPSHSGKKWYSEGAGGLGVTPSGVFWDNVHKVRLPADHPYYSKAPTTPERDPALWDRMEAYIRAMAKGFHYPYANEDGITHYDAVAQASAIVAALPKPVDPDLAEAREVCFTESLSPSREDSTYLKGGLDNSLSMRCALAAIRRGRALQRGEA